MNRSAGGHVISQPFDRDALIDRVDGDTEFLAESVALLDEDGPPLLREIRDSASANDSERVARAAHTFKGLVSNFCADSAAEAARRVEALGRDGVTEGLDAAISSLDAEASLLMKSLREFITDLQK
ncbi:MAG: Hpt domain-containing protein [Planctomycetota bacterium]